VLLHIVLYIVMQWMKLERGVVVRGVVVSGARVPARVPAHVHVGVHVHATNQSTRMSMHRGDRGATALRTAAGDHTEVPATYTDMCITRERATIVTILTVVCITTVVADANATGWLVGWWMQIYCGKMAA